MIYIASLSSLFIYGVGLTTGFLFFSDICLSITSVKADWKFEYASSTFYLDLDKCGPLITMCDVFDFSNLVKTATCLTKIAEPSLLDVIITNRPNHCQNT
jgi:hypothetical protein